MIEQWRQQYNRVRPHAALGYRPPAPGGYTPPWNPVSKASSDNVICLTSLGTKSRPGQPPARSPPHWWIRYADRNGRIIRETTGTSVKKLAREILAKKKVLVAKNRHMEVKKAPKTTLF